MSYFKHTYIWCCSDPAPDEKLLNPPIHDLELGYDALVKVAYGMHLEGNKIIFKL